MMNMQAVPPNLRRPWLAPTLLAAGLVALALALPSPGTTVAADRPTDAESVLPVVEPGRGPVAGDALHRSQNLMNGPAARATGPTPGPTGLATVAARIRPARPTGVTVAAVNPSPSPHRVLCCVWRL
jgi:hypothetical protein